MKPGEPVPDRDVAGAIVEAKQAFETAVRRATIADLAFIGSASAIYPWEPARLVDLDICLFVHLKDRRVGASLARIGADLRRSCCRRGIDFDFRIIAGAYKPPVDRLDRPFLLVHLALFTEAEYLTQPATMRWGWRKYECRVEPSRLARLAPPKITLDEVRDGAKGVRQRLAMLERGEVVMREWRLPELDEHTFSITDSMPNFAECCFAAAATSARHHARALGHAEADRLTNRDFFDWYAGTVGAPPALGELIALKLRSREQGFGGMAARARELAIAFLRDLEARLRRDAA